MDINSVDSTEDYRIRLETITNFLYDQKGIISLNLFLDIFQNLILDCKSVVPNHNNRYFVNLYKQFKTINTRLYELRLNSDDFFHLKVIGQGAFGQVKLVRHRHTNSLFAMKILNKSQMMSHEGSVFWKEERDIMTGIDSRWIVKLHYAFQDPKKLFMVMEYLPGGNLVNWMSKLEDILEQDVCFYVAEIVLAISALHDYNFVHRDIKPDNMLLDSRGHVKLADFGTCVRIDPATKLISCNRAVGTPDYISPEVLQSQNGDVEFGRDSDWWSLGVMIYEIFYGDPPFYSDHLSETYKKIMTHTQSLTFPPDEQISDNAVSLIRGLICDRSVRLGQLEGANDIKSHQFFKHPKNLWTWDNIHECQAPFIPELENELDTTNFDTPDDADRNDLFSKNNKELTPSVFTGENLQFSGFSYGDIFNESKQTPPKTSPLLIEKVVDESVNDITVENQRLASKIHSLSKENQAIKSSLEKLSIERKDLENQIKNTLTKLKTEVDLSRKLQLDYSDLMSKHGMCQQKFSRLEEEKHKLCADLANLQSRHSDENKGLNSQLELQKEELASVNGKLSEAVVEYRKSKLDNVKLENDMKFLQKRCDSLGQEIVRLKSLNDKGDPSTTMPVTGDKLTNFTSEMKDLRRDYDDKCLQLQHQVSENESLFHQITDIQRDNESLRLSLMKMEEENGRQKVSIGNFNILIKEKNTIIEDQNKRSEADRIKIDLLKKIEKESNVKIMSLTKQRIEEKQKFNYDLEDQRMKMNGLLLTRTGEVHELSTKVEMTTNENVVLKAALELEKDNCQRLVTKINQIINGQSATADQMIISEGIKSGKVDKRARRIYHQAVSESKRFEGLFYQLQKDSAQNEKEYKLQIEELTREKHNLENENGCLKNSVAFYENCGMSEAAANRASVITYSSHGSYDSGFTVDAFKATSTPQRAHRPQPPLFNAPSANISQLTSQSRSNQVSVRLRNEKDLDTTIHHNKTKTYDSCRDSITESVYPMFQCQEGQIDVNVKNKGKKMSWEKRFVKLEGQNLRFYNQSMDTCLLQLPLCSLMFVRPVTQVDIIHAKKSELPLIFQIFYDKNYTLYSEIMNRQSMSGSACSINTIGSSKSSGKGSIINDFNETNTNDFSSMKQDHRKGSVSKLLFGSKKSTKEELTMNSLPIGSVILKGHIFQLCTFELKNKCDICKKSLAVPTATGTINQSQRIITDHITKHMETLSSTVDITKTYTCYHCGMNVHGAEITEKITQSCNESNAIQLCRTSSEQQRSDWIASLNNVIQTLKKPTASTPSMSRADFKVKSATLS